MAKLSVRLSRYNNNGACFSIEDTQSADSITVALRSTNPDATTVCRLAAQRLRRLADVADKLAEADEPFKATTQARMMRAW